MVNERRRTARRRVCLSGEIETAAFLPAISCAVRNVSLEGAQIRITSTAILPPRLLLYVPQKRETRLAAVMWREGDFAGLRFDVLEAGGALRHRLVEGEAEIERLRTALLARTGGAVH